MNTTTQNITILHDAQEWSTDLDGEIGEVRVDGTRLNDVHDLTLKVEKVEGIAQSLKTLVLCLGVILMISLICNISIATWVLIHDSCTLDAIEQILATK